MPLPHASKDKSARLDWGYHARPSGPARTRRRLWLLAAAVALPLAGLAATAAAVGRVPRPLAVAASRGPLVRAHAMWDDKCEACHTPFQPINSAGWLDRLTGAAPRPTAEPGQCGACHAAPPHHPNPQAAPVEACADCHHDHQGRDHRLSRPADPHCTRCHAATGAGDFATNHPPFRNNPADTTEPFRRALRFAHGPHLDAAMQKPMQAVASAMSPADRERYDPYLTDLAAGRRDALCAFCHQLDANRSDGAKSALSLAELFSDRTRGTLGGLPVEAILPPRAAGTNSLPVTYEAHCQACHPLTFDSDKMAELKGVAVPHRLAPDALERFLRQTYTERLVAGKLPESDDPARGPGRLDPSPAVAAEVGKLIDGRVTVARTLFASEAGGCAKCHEPDGAGGYRPVNTPTVWQPRARFDHTSHRMAKCSECHKADSVADPPARGFHGPADLPAIESCRQCHSPAGGAGHGCTDCHAYHHADRRLQGRGAAAFRPGGGGR